MSGLGWNWLFLRHVIHCGCCRALGHPHDRVLPPTDNRTARRPAGYPDSWLAIALSDAGGMHGADMMLVAGGTAAAGGAAWRALDLHSLDFVQPQMDEHQASGLAGHGAMRGPQRWA